MTNKSSRNGSESSSSKLENKVSSAPDIYESNYLQRDLDRFQESIHKWRKKTERIAHQTQDHSLTDLADRDKHDLLKVYQTIESGDYEEAFHLAGELDTLVRDQIPVRLYNYLAKQAGYH